MKKVLFLSLTAVAALSLAACGGGTTNNSTVETTLNSEDVVANDTLGNDTLVGSGGNDAALDANATDSNVATANAL